MIIKKNKINNAINELNNGNIIIYPTDTIYGLGADATNTLAVQKINSLKGRQTPLSIMIDKIDSINKYAYLDKNQKKQILKILPGPFTILLKTKQSNLSKLVQAKSKKIGIRIPGNVFCLKLLSIYKKPIITTSVNKHGEKSINDIKLIEKTFLDINIYKEEINKQSKGSTIIDFTEKPFKVLRKGEGIF